MRILLIREVHGGYTLESIVADTLKVDTWIFKDSECQDMLDKIRELLATPVKEVPKIAEWIGEVLTNSDSGDN